MFMSFGKVGYNISRGDFQVSGQVLTGRVLWDKGRYLKVNGALVFVQKVEFFYGGSIEVDLGGILIVGKGVPSGTRSINGGARFVDVARVPIGMRLLGN